MSVARSRAEKNHLLAALPRKDLERFVSGCEPVELEFADVLAEPGQRMLHVYFPIASVITLSTQRKEQPSVEVGLVGDEGMLGATVLLGVDDAPLHALVQDGGPALRMSVARFRREIARSPALQHVVQRYLYVVMSQLAQTTACARFHVLEARLARWLLMTLDRVHADSFRSTHAFLAGMLGVRRVGITKAATALQNRKLISYHRGNITVLDRDGLRETACACYETDKAIYARTLTEAHARRQDSVATHHAVADPHAITHAQAGV